MPSEVARLLREAIRMEEDVTKLPRSAIRKRIIKEANILSESVFKHYEYGETIPDDYMARKIMSLLPLPPYFADLCEEELMLKASSVKFRQKAEHAHPISYSNDLVWIRVRRAAANLNVKHKYKIICYGVRSESYCEGEIHFGNEKVVYLIHKKLLSGNLSVEFEIEPPAIITFGTKEDLKDDGKWVETHNNWVQRSYLRLALEYVLKWFRESLRQWKHTIANQ